MISDLPPKVHNWVQDALSKSGTIKLIERLKGSSSTTLYKITTESDAFVLRLYDNEKWLKEEPDLAKHEAASLNKAASKATLNTPKVIAVDESGVDCGVPTVLMSHVPGNVYLEPQNLDDWLKELARVLVELHQIDPKDFKWGFFRFTEPSELEIPSWTKQPELWKKGIEMVKDSPPAYNETFIHRDYHPVNVLWEDNCITGVVDWVNACRGPQAIDVGHCRNNLVCLFGVEAADAFLKYYQTFSGNTFQYDPYWDLVCYFDFVYPGPVGVYQGWLDFGITHLTYELITERLEHYLTTLIG